MLFCRRNPHPPIPVDTGEKTGSHSWALLSGLSNEVTLFGESGGTSRQEDAFGECDDDGAAKSAAGENMSGGGDDARWECAGEND